MTSWTRDDWESRVGNGHRYRYYIMACSCGPVVYLRSLKTASTFFYNNLVQNHGWEEIVFDKIDWDRQWVFSHIIDPVERRHKAFAEYLSMTGTVNLFYENSNFRNMLKTLPMLDVHSVSLHDYFGSRIRNIDWIPLVKDHSENIRITEKLLTEMANMRLFYWDLEFAHVSPREKNQLAQDIAQDWAETSADNGIPDVTWNYLDRDQALYREVLSKFTPNEKNWEQVTWLKNFSELNLR